MIYSEEYEHSFGGNNHLKAIFIKTSWSGWDGGHLGISILVATIGGPTPVQHLFLPSLSMTIDDGGK